MKKIFGGMGVAKDQSITCGSRFLDADHYADPGIFKGFWVIFGGAEHSQSNSRLDFGGVRITIRIQGISGSRNPGGSSVSGSGPLSRS